MSELTLSDIELFHADLLTVRAAGVKMEFGPQDESSIKIDTSTSAALKLSLEQIETSLAAQMARGQSIDSLIAAKQSLPATYAAIFHTWHVTGHLPGAFESVVAVSEENERYGGAFRIAMVQPIVWLLVGYCSLLSICLLTASNFLNLLEDMRSEPGPVLSTVLLIRSGLPVWGWMFPLAILICAWWLRQRSRSRNWSTAAAGQRLSTASQAVSRASMAEQTVNLLRAGAPSEQAIGMLRQVNETQSKQAELPPVLKWASNAQPSESVGTTESARDTQEGMQLAASIYRAIAQIATLQQLRLAKTRLSSVLLGGLLVLGIALCVFGPLIELLYFVAQSN